MKSQQETSSDYGLVQNDENVEFRTQDGTETSSLAIVEIVLRVSAALFAVGALVGAAVTLANVEDTFPDNPFGNNNTQANEFFSDLEDDEDGYRSQAVFVVFACSVGIVMQTLMVIVRGLFFVQKITKRFIIFAIVNTVSSTFLTLSFISGGVSSGTNAADVQDYIDLFHCDDLDDFSMFNIPIVRDTCDDLMSLRDSMVASAVLQFIGGLLFAGLLLVMVITTVMKCKEKSKS